MIACYKKIHTVILRKYYVTTALCKCYVKYYDYVSTKVFKIAMKKKQ